MADEYWGPFGRSSRGSSFADKMQALERSALAAVPERSTAAVGALTGRAYALTHPKVLARVQQVTAQAYQEEKILTPELVSDEVFFAALGLLAREAWRLRDDRGGQGRARLPTRLDAARFCPTPPALATQHGCDGIWRMCRARFRGGIHLCCRGTQCLLAPRAGGCHYE